MRLRDRRLLSGYWGYSTIPVLGSGRAGGLTLYMSLAGLLMQNRSEESLGMVRGRSSAMDFNPAVVLYSVRKLKT